MNEAKVDEIALQCVAAYDELPHSGKPEPNHWTVYSCILLTDYFNDTTDVVSIGTGSKCIGSKKMCPKGFILNDSHAEIIARRGFLLFLYDQMEKALSEKNSIFYFSTGKFYLKAGIEFTFFSSQLPCGDACIIPKETEKKVAPCNEPESPPYKKPRNDDSNNDYEIEDIFRTGAKCLPWNEQDPKLPGASYHNLGQVRLKPGRGDPTLSVSCSDKIARWNCVGIQGALLSLLLASPIYIKNFIFGGGVPFSEVSLRRALLTRNKCLYLTFEPAFYQTSVNFGAIRECVNKKPAPASIVSINTVPPLTEVAVMGKKLGTTKKTNHTEKSCLSISKFKLFKRFLHLVRSNDELREIILPRNENPTYKEVKKKSVSYNSNSQEAIKLYFGSWTVKPDGMLDFTVSD